MNVWQLSNFQCHFTQKTTDLKISDIFVVQLSLSLSLSGLSCFR